MGFLAWNPTNIGFLTLHVGGAGTEGPPSLGRGHITFLAGTGAIYWGAGATIVTATDGRAVGAVGPCCTGNSTDLSLEREGLNFGSKIAPRWMAVVGRIMTPAARNMFMS